MGTNVPNLCPVVLLPCQGNQQNEKTHVYSPWDCCVFILIWCWGRCGSLECGGQHTLIQHCSQTIVHILDDGHDQCSNCLGQEPLQKVLTESSPVCGRQSMPCRLWKYSMQTLY